MVYARYANVDDVRCRWNSIIEHRLIFAVIRVFMLKGNYDICDIAPCEELQKKQCIMALCIHYAMFNNSLCYRPVIGRYWKIHNTCAMQIWDRVFAALISCKTRWRHLKICRVHIYLLNQEAEESLLLGLKYKTKTMFKLITPRVPFQVDRFVVLVPLIC